MAFVKTRYLLLLRELEGYSVAQLVETTGPNENTIRMKLLHPARTRQVRTEPSVGSTAIRPAPGARSSYAPQASSAT
jgi:hypothetical protein